MKRLWIALVMGMAITAGVAGLSWDIASAQDEADEEILMISGEVTALDASAGTFVVIEEAEEGEVSGDPLTVSVDPMTMIDKGGERIGLDAVAVGDMVTVEYQLNDDGNAIAVNIWLEE